MTFVNRRECTHRFNVKRFKMKIFRTNSNLRQFGARTRHARKTHFIATYQSKSNYEYDRCGGKYKRADIIHGMCYVSRVFRHFRRFRRFIDCRNAGMQLRARTIDDNGTCIVCRSTMRGLFVLVHHQATSEDQPDFFLPRATVSENAHVSGSSEKRAFFRENDAILTRM